MSESDNKIIIYNTNEGPIVKFKYYDNNNKIWMTQQQMATILGCSTDNI